MKCYNSIKKYFFEDIIEIINYLKNNDDGKGINEFLVLFLYYFYYNYKRCLNFKYVEFADIICYSNKILNKCLKWDDLKISRWLTVNNAICFDICNNVKNAEIDSTDIFFINCVDDVSGHFQNKLAHIKFCLIINRPIHRSDHTNYFFCYETLAIYVEQLKFQMTKLYSNIFIRNKKEMTKLYPNIFIRNIKDNFYVNAKIL